MKMTKNINQYLVGVAAFSDLSDLTFEKWKTGFSKCLRVSECGLKIRAL